MNENLPAVPEDAEIVEGVIVDEPQATAARPVYVLHVVKVVIRHEHTRAVARHAAYVPAGAVVLARRRSRGRTLALDFAHQAKASGDHPNGLLWAAHHEAQLKARHERQMARFRLVIDLAKAAPWIAGVTLIAMMTLNVLLFVATHRAADLAWSFVTLAHVVEFAIAAASVLAVAAFVVVPLAGRAWLHHLGRNAGDLAPGWGVSAKQAKEERGLVVTADSIVVALQNTPVPDLRKAFVKDGWRPSFHTLPIKDGEGYFSVFSLPMGVTPEMIADKVDVFARNLHRAKVEVWPTNAERDKIAPAGYVALRVLNPGVLDRPAPEYPLLHEGQADIFEGVPGGVIADGSPELLPVAASNLVLGGQMGNGKSNGCRVYMLGCATDPLCQLEVFVFANNGDFDSFAPRLAVYRKGTEDDVVIAAVTRMNGLLDEVGRREGRLAELGAKKLTRRIAEQHADLRPIVVLFSECHELFGHKEYGEAAAEVSVKVIKRARKTGVTLVFDTQSSRKAAIPPELVELVSVNGCFYVKSWRSNDGFLGDGSFQAGIRATELRPGRDIGRSVVTGISDAQFELLKWYFVEVDDDTGYDAAAEVIERCMQTVAPGTLTASNSLPPAITVRDLLGDLGDVVTGAERVKLRDAVGLLRKVDARYPRYRQMTAAQLRDDLAAEGVKAVNSSGTLYLDPAQLHRALAERGE